MGKSKSDLETYRAKRDFSRTPEPEGDAVCDASAPLRYIVQKHAASHLHFDFRLELDGVLKSWAVPKGPSLDPSDKRLAMHVEDHPLTYGDFEGTIPKGEYGGGTVMLWDRGSWEPQGDPRRDYRKGRLTFRLHGERLKGLWSLSRMGGKATAGENKWLLIKKRDEEASDVDVTGEATTSVSSGRSMEEIAGSDAPPQCSTKEEVPGKEEPPFASFDFKGLKGARPGDPPEVMRPQLAKLVQKAPAGGQWLHEIKYDGYRILCVIEKGKVRLISRNGQDWTDRFGEIAGAAAELPVERALIDGEIAVVDEKGATDFQALQNVLRSKETGRMVYFVFDLPYLEGWDITRVPLEKRKELLARIAPSAAKAQKIRYSDHIAGSGEAVYRNACRFALEGVVSKKADAPYRSRRSDAWQKLKCLNRQEFVIAGWTDPGSGGTGIGALLLGIFEEGGSFTYAGRVGTGFSTDMRRELAEQLKEREQPDPPFSEVPAGEGGKGVHWMKPEMMAEVEFTSWTRDGRLRHPSFKGIREDKEPGEIRRELSPPPDGADKPEKEERGSEGRSIPRAKQTFAGVTLSNPDRVLYPGQGLTKKALAGYFERVAPLLLPHIVKRPLTLVRCPRGQQKKCFFQRHHNETLPPFVRAVTVKEKGGKTPYLLIDDLSGLISLVQLGVLEIHPWGSREDRLERPDRVIFDLDPGPGVPWKRVLDAARDVGGLLDDLGLKSFVKTTGGKGLHVVVPLQRRSAWDEVKAFARGVALRLARENPQGYVAVMSKSRRSGKIFIDYLRNSRGATSVAPFVTRALPGAPVSAPVAWRELGSLTGAAHYTVANLPRRLAHLESDPWDGFFDLRQSITKAIWEKLGY